MRHIAGIVSSTKRALALAAAAGALVMLGAACIIGGDDDGGGNGFPVIIETPPITDSPPPTQAPTPTPTPSPTPTLLPVCGTNPDPAPANLLQVTMPKPNEEVTVPFQVQGWGSTIGMDNSGVALAILDFRQQTLDVLNLPPQPRAHRLPPSGLDLTDDTRPFGADVIISGVVEPTRYCLWVYLETDEEGHAQDVVQVPITVVPGE